MMLRTFHQSAFVDVRMLPPLLRAGFVCSLLVVVSCQGDSNGLVAQKTGGLLQWLHSLLPSALVGQNPYFCKWYDCPSFTVTATNWLYETRNYGEVSWVTCQLPYGQVSRFDLERARQVCFWTLYKYITGDNAASKTIKMTVPVIERFDNSTGAFMGFYIPGSADTVPAPTDSSLSVVVQQPTTYYVRSFAGYGYDTRRGIDNWAINTDILKKALQKDGQVWGNSLTAAGYDSPWSPFFRHNEVWLESPANN